MYLNVSFFAEYSIHVQVRPTTLTNSSLKKVLYVVQVRTFNQVRIGRSQQLFSEPREKLLTCDILFH